MSAAPTIAVRRLAHAAGLPLPAYESDGAAGMDLRCATPQDRPLVLKPGERVAAPTGLCMAIPTGFEGQVRARSGLSIREGVTCLNAPGTVDSDYRGEVRVILINLGQADAIIRRGDRIAQLVVAPIVKASWIEVEDLDATPRGAGGFGSTGGR